jgi:hypothetical protein
MPLRPLLPAILLALVMSIAVGVLAAGRNSGVTLMLAVGLFALQMLFAMVRTNAPFWRSSTEPGEEEEEDPAVGCVWRNAVLAALVYAWSATAMLAIYSLSSLVWRHWWQYGAATALVSAAIFFYAYLLSAGRGPLRTPQALGILMGLTAVQGLVLSGLLVYLVLWGKLVTPRGDWAANHIFAAGSVTLALLSIVTILTYRRLVRRPVRHGN